MGGTYKGGGRGSSKPKRGGPKRFTPRSRLEKQNNEEDPFNEHLPEGEESSNSSESEDSLSRQVATVEIGCTKEKEAESSGSESEDQEPVEPKNIPKQPQPSRPPHEMTRKEREAIEKERARQHYLKMKEREDAARLAVIKKRREEEAARAAAEKQAKEEASRRRKDY